jgi:nucleoside-diphosphate-sugar epimerase
MKILVTGGCGYVGSVLVPDLLLQGHQIEVVDTQWFGSYLSTHPNLRITRKAVSAIDVDDVKDKDAVIHLANIANDPSVDLNPVLSWEVNALHTNQLLELCKRHSNISTFIYASSGSVYGVKSEAKVTEDLELVPISVYNKTKMVTERICSSFEDSFYVYNVRPATVCGISPRMRFDVVVNMFVLQAFKNKKITVLGGDQVRPNIHINDMSSVYSHLLSAAPKSGSYNAGFENLLVSEIADMVANKFGVEIEVKPSNDPRSYRQDSTKLLSTGFIPRFKTIDAINQMGDALQGGAIEDNARWHTVSWMKQINSELVS